MRLLRAEGVGPVTARLLLSHFGLPENIFSASYSTLSRIVPERTARALLAPPTDALKASVERAVTWAAEAGNHVITLADPAYPRALLDTADPPILLYAKGELALLSRPALAIVGSRNATIQGMQDAQNFAHVVSAVGVTIVSGLALGIDAAAHLGALDALEQDQQGAGSTIAVIGTGADIVYPARNRPLAHRIAAAGLILSEYPLGTAATSVNFPRRNRIISGLSRAVLVVEAAAHSGSLITARMALDQNRDVFAIPGSIHSALSKGCHQLIKQGAKLVESAEDVLEELRAVLSEHAAARSTAPITTNVAPPVQLEPVLQHLLDTMGYDPVEINLLAERAALDAASVAAHLLALEMAGVVESLPGARYQRLA
ncbi:DNA-processing protein DprA [Lacisediminimonas sp.]|uniref:DNA-processing protein DprA n=1 Tax=Lacisediminimonas sp. TaxID=3060582 RepID=UPI002728EBCA|nr:DNA-processing protein DprA [Lacisediminimonas sp.]MDO8299411.1 DNA-processing protein DprA [Lacisediminimonas sp.]